MIILDASVILKWFVVEDNSEAALEFMAKGDDLWAPAIAEEEVLNGLIRAVRHDRLTDADAKLNKEAWQQDIADRVPALIPHASYLDDAFEFATALRHPYYDCLYLALAKWKKRHTGNS